MLSSAFLDMVLSRIHAYSEVMAQHWISQTDTCPLYSMNYPVVGRFEEMDEDTGTDNEPGVTLLLLHEETGHP